MDMEGLPSVYAPGTVYHSVYGAIYRTGRPKYAHGGNQNKLSLVGIDEYNIAGN